MLIIFVRFSMDEILNQMNCSSVKNCNRVRNFLTEIVHIKNKLQYKMHVALSSYDGIK